MTRPKGTTKEQRMMAREAKGLPRIIQKDEWLATLMKAKNQVGLWLAAWLAFDCVFGKRRNEICRLKWSDVRVENGYLFVDFTVGKKKSRVEPLSSKIYYKSKTLDHYAMPYILEYLRTKPKPIQKSCIMPNVENPGLEYLFPAKIPITDYPSSKVKKKTFTVHRVFLNGKGDTIEKDYVYPIPEGYRKGDSVRYYVNKVNPDIWLHLGRTTIGTKAAETGASQFDIANILDIAPQTAWHYAEHGTAKTKAWNDEAI